jgi:hypothetical protein
MSPAILSGLLILCAAAIPAAEAPAPPPLIEGRNIDGHPPINSRDPITDDPVDPRVGTYCLIMEVTEAKGPVTDLDPSRRLVCIGFSAPSSLEAFAGADRVERERLARKALRTRVEKQLHLEPGLTETR